MQLQKEKETMLIAYGELYEVENLIRSYIREKMQEHFGVHWFHIAPRTVYKRLPKKEFERLMFHEYEQVYLRAYPQAFKNLNPTFFNKLHSLYPLRNKIAHNHCLEEKELIEMIDVCNLIRKYLLY